MDSSIGRAISRGAGTFHGKTQPAWSYLPGKDLGDMKSYLFPLFLRSLAMSSYWVNAVRTQKSRGLGHFHSVHKVQTLKENTEWRSVENRPGGTENRHLI